MVKTTQESLIIATSTLELLKKTLEHMKETAITRYKAGDKVINKRTGRNYFSQKNTATEMAKIALPEEAIFVCTAVRLQRNKELNELILKTGKEFNEQYPKIRSKNKKTRELIVYLEPKIDQKTYLRRSATELIKDDFYLEHLMQFFKIIENESTSLRGNRRKTG